MQGFDILGFLDGNQWVKAAEFSGSANNRKSGSLLVDLSTEGHKLVCEQGLQVFSEKVTERLTSMNASDVHWGFRPVEKGVFDTSGAGFEGELPPVISKIEEISRHSLLLEVSADMTVFQGHFPGNPILPGIVQLHWATGISMALFSFTEAPCEVKRLKFKNIVQPPAILELVLRRPNKHEIHFQFNSAGQIHSMGCFVTGEDLPC